MVYGRYLIGVLLFIPWVRTKISDESWCSLRRCSLILGSVIKPGWGEMQFKSKMDA